MPWKSFARIIEQYDGDKGVRSLGCTDLFRAMAFAQLTSRESLRDLETCLSANHTRLFHMGFKSIPARSTLSDALNSRDWQIFRDLAMNLIARARKLYAADSHNIDLDATVYALDSTTIDLCMALFDWALFRTTKSAIKVHTLLDLRGNIPAFIHVSNGKMSDVKIQIWSAIASYVLIAIIKKDRFIDTPLYTILQILSVSIFERTELLCALQTRAYKSVLTPSDNQLNLF